MRCLSVRQRPRDRLAPSTPQRYFGESPTRLSLACLMLPALTRTSAVVALAACLISAAAQRDRRVVDVVVVGNEQSEARHGYDGLDAVRSVANGETFRQSREWMHFTMTTFDDTEVTIACTMVRASGNTDDVPRTFDLVVEDSVVATRTSAVPSTAPVTVEVHVPFALTKGKTNIVVVIRARGGPTPAFRELRTIQDHYEVSYDVAASAERLSTLFRVPR